MKLIKGVKHLIANIHIWRYHDRIERTCRVCGKSQINIVQIKSGGWPPLVDCWYDNN